MPQYHNVLSTQSMAIQGETSMLDATAFVDSRCNYESAEVQRRLNNSTINPDRSISNQRQIHTTKNNGKVTSLHLDMEDGGAGMTNRNDTSVSLVV